MTAPRPSHARVAARLVLAAMWLFGPTLSGVAAMSSIPPAGALARKAPRVILNPGPEYGGRVRMFQGIPGIERAANGRLWATWYGGGRGEDRHNYVLLATSGDDGGTWTKPMLIVDPDGDGPVRAFDPCLWHDPSGRLWLFWAQRPGGTAALWAITTDDSGAASPTWSAPQLVGDGILMNKPLARADGTRLLPVANWHHEGSAGILASSDRGKTWSRLGGATVPDPKQRDCDEHMLVERRDGSLWMLIRTKYGIGESASADGGRTWSDAVPSAIGHTTSRFFIRRLASGALLLIKHGPLAERTGRSHLTAYLSGDDGKTWAGGLLLDERKGVSYPDGVQAPDGTVYVIYDFDRLGAKTILLAAFAEADVRAGKPVSGKTRLRQLVNQATGVRPKRSRK